MKNACVDQSLQEFSVRLFRFNLGEGVFSMYNFALPSPKYAIIELCFPVFIETNLLIHGMLVVLL